MKKFINRLLKKEEGIRDWLKTNKLESLLHKADQILNNLPREEIKKEFEEEIKRALEHCAKNTDIKALDFSWYYAGREIGGALAYGLDSCISKVSKTDLGPDELPGLELKLKHGVLIDEYFAEIPVYHAINALVKDIMPILEKMEIYDDTDDLITYYFEIWNYKIAYEVCQQLSESDVVVALKSRAPFWITMTRQDRWPVGIMLID